MTRALYNSLLWLHPPAFRRQFAADMLWIFDEARVTEGALGLLLDGVVSLLRQWVLRSGLWIVATALLGAVLQVAPTLRMGSRLRSGRLFATGAPMQTELFVALVTCTIAFVVSMVIASVCWATWVSRRAVSK